MATKTETAAPPKKDHFDTIVRHIGIVQEACSRLGKQLMEKGDDTGRILIANSFLHDNSKFYGIEWESLTSPEENKVLFKAALSHHQKTNKHHPEYWDGIKNMPRVYLAELVCDLYARSAEFGTDLREYLKGTFMPKHEITVQSTVYKQIKEFLDLLLEEPFKPL